MDTRMPRIPFDVCNVLFHIFVAIVGTAYTLTCKARNTPLIVTDGSMRRVLYTTEFSDL